MSSINLNDLYVSMQNEMINKLNLGKIAFNHPGTKGDEIESNWIEWFENYLPKRYKVDKGIIIDSKGNQSDQIDIIIYDIQYSYLVFHHNDSLLIPIESVYAVFEVKPNLNKVNMEYAANKARSVRELYRTSVPIKHAGGSYPAKALHEIIAGLLTTVCDWQRPIEQNVVNYINGKSREERLDMVCDIEDSSFVVENNTFINEYTDKVLSKIKFCNGGNSLVFFLLNLLIKLQNIGTVPAIDFTKYSEIININYVEGR